MPKKSSPSEDFALFIAAIILIIFWFIGLYVAYDFSVAFSKLIHVGLKTYLPNLDNWVVDKISFYIGYAPLVLYIVSTIFILLKGSDKSR